MIFFFSVFTLYTAINYYIFIRGWQALAYHPNFRIVYLIIFLLMFTSFIISKLLIRYIPSSLYIIMQWFGSFWFAFMLYFVLFIALFDILRLLNYFFDFFPTSVSNNYSIWKFGIFISVILITLFTVIAGFINTRIINIKNLDITLRKGLSPLSELNIVAFADIHLTAMNNEKLLSRIIDEVNSLNPDLVLIPGDFADEKSEWLEARGIGKAFSNLNLNMEFTLAPGTMNLSSELIMFQDLSEIIISNYYVMKIF